MQDIAGGVTGYDAIPARPDGHLEIAAVNRHLSQRSLSAHTFVEVDHLGPVRPRIDPTNAAALRTFQVGADVVPRPFGKAIEPPEVAGVQIRDGLVRIPSASRIWPALVIARPVGVSLV